MKKVFLINIKKKKGIRNITIIIKTKSEQNIKNIIEGQTRKPICFSSIFESPCSRCVVNFIWQYENPRKTKLTLISIVA